MAGRNRQSSMRHLLRQFRRPVVILAVLYLASVGLLTAVMQPRPAVEVCIRLTDDRHYKIVGLSPDGRTMATRQDSNGPGGKSIDLTEPETIWLWDLAPPFYRRVESTAVASNSPMLRFSSSYLDKRSNWQRVFWQLLQSSSPDPQFRRLVYGAPSWGVEWLSPEGRSLLRDWSATSTPGHRAYLIIDWSGPRHDIQIPLAERPLDISNDAKWVTTPEYGSNADSPTPRPNGGQHGDLSEASQHIRQTNLDGLRCYGDRPLWAVACVIGGTHRRRILSERLGPFRRLGRADYRNEFHLAHQGMTLVRNAPPPLQG